MADDGRREIWATLEPSSYRGIPWFVESITTSGGRKATPKAIVNSSDQIVDDVGLKQRTYQVRGLIAAKYSKVNASAQDTLEGIAEEAEARAAREKRTGVTEKGALNLGQGDAGISADYREMRLLLTTAFELRGSASLIHHIEGEITNLICTEFSIEEAMSQVGIGRVTATFVRETTTPIPRPVGGAAEDVEGDADDADDQVDAQVIEDWSVGLALADAYEIATEQLGDAYALGLVVAESVETATDAMDKFQRDISILEADVFSVVSDAISVADSIKGVFDSLNGLFPLPAAAFAALQNGFDFGNTDLDFDFSTPSGKQKKKNQNALNASIQTRYLTQAYRAALDLEYVTTDDVALVESILEAQHRKIVDGTEASDSVKEALTSLRESFFDFLGTAKLQARGLVEEEVTTVTPRVLSYLLYEDDSETATIAGLNGVRAYETISGSVTVLSA